MTAILETSSESLAEPAKAAGGAAIEADQLTKIYGNRRAVDGLSFSVARGEILGLLGPNGAGKTTTMRILSGYTPASSGRAAIAGFDVARQSTQARSRLGYLPESAPIYLTMSVAEYLNFMAEIKRVPRADRARAVDSAISECNLGEVRNRLTGTLSKGFRQRVGLAQAILGDPAVLILDEPTVGLDPQQIAEIRTLIKGMAGRRTVLISTHILPEVSMTCSRVIVLSRGKIVASGTPEKLVSGVKRDAPIRVVVSGDAARAREIISKVHGVREVALERESPESVALLVVPSPVLDPRAEIAKAVIESGLALLELSTTGGSLEDVFLEVISTAREEQ